jgi:hypothetical protein
VEEFNYLDNMVTNHAKCTREIKARIAIAKAAFNKKKHQQIRLRAKEENSHMLDLEHSFVWCGNWDSSETRSHHLRKDYWDKKARKET